MRRAEKQYPHEVFDIICGTSTGGIIAVVLGTQCRRVDETEAMYDDFIEKVFGKKSNLKLVSEQALYDANELEKILYSIVGDELFIDSNRNDCSKVFCVSTKVSTIPQTQIWRNYNYPQGQNSRYVGSSRINTLTAIRASTAAPTFFTPVQWEGGLYCDGALVANNPTAIALQEAKALFPGVPIELVVSIGTGSFYNELQPGRPTMGWDTLVNQIISSSVDTEDTHSLLSDFLPSDKYFRFNPQLTENINIDEKDKNRLSTLKKLALKMFDEMEKDKESKLRLDNLFKLLKTGVKI